MLELTRRMTLKRNCFDRIAGAYLDEEEFGQMYRTDKSYAIYFFHGSYDVPLKASRGNMALPFTCMIAGWIVVAVLYRKRCGDAQGINYGLEQLHIVVALKGSLDILKP